MDITEILNAFPSEEINSDGNETKRDFWVPEQSGSSAHFFAYFPQSNEIELSACKYSMNSPDLMTALQEKFSNFNFDEMAFERLKNKFALLSSDRDLIRQLDFVKCQDLESLQVQKHEDGEMLDKLEHFTDWIIGYVQATKLWQVRFPGKILKLSVVFIETNKGEDGNSNVLSKYVLIENLDAFEEKYFLKVEYVYDLNNIENMDAEAELDFYETRTFFMEGKQCVDPTQIDDFDIWYRVIILGEDPHEDDEDDYKYDDDEI